MNKRAAKKLDARQLSVLFAPRAVPVPAPVLARPTRKKATSVRAPAVAPVAVKPAVKRNVKPVVTRPVAGKAETPPHPASSPASSPVPPPAPKAEARAPIKPTLPDPVEWGENFARIAKHSQALLKDFARRQKQVGAPLQATSVVNSFVDLTGRMMSNPIQMVASQTQLWRQYVDLWQHSTHRFLNGGEGKAVTRPDPADRRFKDPAWQENPVFDHIKQSYLLTARWLQGQVQEVDGLDPAAKKKLDFYTRQFMDALSPSNFALTNPQVLRTTLETGGENLVKGLENLLKDMEAGRIRMTDETAFSVGRNIATTPGAVVFENELIQLIQYTPTTKTVARVPLLIVPPWINKFYILDLKPENSFIKWAVDQGLTVFCISWVNPDRELARLSFEDYMEKGVLTAMEQVRRSSGCRDLNAIGYCLGGTLLASTLAYLHATDPALAKTVRSATYFVTLVDFSDPGELGVFIDDTQLEALEKQMTETGYLDAVRMASTFNLLRANDLIWSFVVNNYLLGKEPFPFDLLYWNSDSTRMPAAMHSFYLRNMYQHNKLAQPGGITLKGVPIDLRTIRTPSYLLSAREDHITPWESTYAGTKLYKGPVTFTLAGSGHIAGVINPPAANKYNFWSSDTLPSSAQTWLDNATEHTGSWWPHWRKWLNLYAGDTIPARKITHPIEPAPGRYVAVRAV